MLKTTDRTIACFLLTLACAANATAQRQPTVAPQQRVDPGGGTRAANETTASASAANPLHIVTGWNDWRLSPAVPDEVINTGFALSLDGGMTWDDFLLRPPEASQGWVEGDPFSAADARTGYLWAGGISFTAGSNGGIYVAAKAPEASSFGPSVMARVGSSTDKPWMVAGPRPGQPDTTRLYIVYNEGVIRSDDLGQTWTDPQALTSGVGFMPRVGPAGELYVSYWDFGSGMKLMRSLDGGDTFTTHNIATRLDVWGVQDGSRFPGTFRVPSMCYIAVDPNSGRVYATYFDTTSVNGGESDVDIYFTHSDDQGTTWTTPVRINHDNSGDQFYCWIECDSYGRLHLLYGDSRNMLPHGDGDPDGMFDTYYAYSVNAGATWTEHRLSSVTWNSDNDGLNRAQQFIGDYFGIALAGNTVIPTYISSQNGDPDVYINRIDLPVPGDIDGDGLAGFSDLISLLSAWGPCKDAPCDADLNGDGLIGFADLTALLSLWTE